MSSDRSLDRVRCLGESYTPKSRRVTAAQKRLDELRPEIVNVMQKSELAQLFRVNGFLALRHEPGAADCNDLLFEEKFGRHSRTERRVAISDGDIDIVVVEIGEAVGCQDLKIDFRMLLGELRQKRNKPFRRESRRDADSEMDRLRPKVSCRAVDQLKCPANVRGITSSFTGQRKRFGEPFEQLETDFCFQPPDVLRNRPLGHPEFFSRGAKIEVARSHFEGAERIERGDTVKRFRHRRDFLSDNKRKTRSLLRNPNDISTGNSAACPPSALEHLLKKLAYLAFLFLGIVWGTNFIFVQWAAAYITTGQIVLLRALFGVVPVFLYALLSGALSFSHLRHLHHFVVMSLLATTVYYLAFARGTVLLPSSVAGMLSGAIPLFTFISAWLFLREEPLNRKQGLGVIIGFLGVLTIARPWTATIFDISGVLYMIAGSFSVGVSFVYAKKFVAPLKLPTAALTTYQIGIAAITLAVLTDTAGIRAVFSDNRAWIGLVFGLGLCGTGLAYVAYYFIVEKLGAVTAASVTYLPPLVAIMIGLLVGEQLDGFDIAAIVLILTGVAVLQLATLRHKTVASRNKRDTVQVNIDDPKGKSCTATG